MIKNLENKMEKMQESTNKGLEELNNEHTETNNTITEVKIGNSLEKEFRIMIVKMIQDLGKRMEAKIEKMQEMFTKELEELKNTKQR